MVLIELLIYIAKSRWSPPQILEPLIQKPLTPLQMLEPTFFGPSKELTPTPSQSKGGTAVEPLV